jgi:hypothetical protein
VKQEKRNIEDFLKDKLDGFDAGYQNDWSQFETKLDRAILYYRMKVGALIGVVLLLITLGVAGGEGLSNLTNTDNRSAASPAFLHSLRQRAPFILGKDNIRLANSASSSSAQINEQTNTRGVVMLNDTEDKPSDETYQKAQLALADEMVTLKIKSPQSHLIASKESSLPGIQKGGISSSGKPTMNEIISPKEEMLVVEGNNRPEEDVIMASRSMETPVAVDDHYVLEPDLLYTATDQVQQSQLDIRPVILPAKFKKAPAYISPLQAKNPWSYSVSVYPNFTFRKFKVDREKLNLIHRDFIDATQEAESGGFSLNVGFVVSRRIGRITYLNGGVEYINYKAKAEYDFYNYREANIDPLTDQILNYSLLTEPEHISFSGDNVYHYVNFPLSISHKPWATDHVRLNIEAGGSFMYFLGARGQAIDYQSLEIIDIADREYNNSIASLHMKVGVSYYVSERFNFGLEPTLMYFTNTIYSEDYPFQVIPYSVGVNFKLQVKLN